MVGIGVELVNVVDKVDNGDIFIHNYITEYRLDLGKYLSKYKNKLSKEALFYLKEIYGSNWDFLNKYYSLNTGFKLYDWWRVDITDVPKKYYSELEGIKSKMTGAWVEISRVKSTVPSREYIDSIIKQYSLDVKAINILNKILLRG